jgi:hypothetical protein
VGSPFSNRASFSWERRISLRRQALAHPLRILRLLPKLGVKGTFLGVLTAPVAKACPCPTSQRKSRPFPELRRWRRVEKDVGQL